jgi:hypothetical protein
MVKVRHSRIPWSWFSVCLILLVAFPAVGYSMTVTLAWDPPATGTVDGYNLYYKAGDSGASYDGTEASEGDSPIDVGKVTSFTVSGLDSTLTYYFVVTAYNTSGESEPSNEASTEASTDGSATTDASTGGGGGGGGGSCFINTINGTTDKVPASRFPGPPTILLLGTGLVGLVGLRRKFRR